MGIKGLDTFMDVAEVIANPKKYEAKVAEIRKLVDQYTEAAEAVVALANVNDYTQNIKKREEESKHILDAAKVDAAAIVASAKKRADEMADKSRAKEAELAKVENDLMARQAKIDKEVEAQATDALAISEWKAKLDQRETALAAAEQVLEAKQAKLKAALA